MLGTKIAVCCGQMPEDARRNAQQNSIPNTEFIAWATGETNSASCTSFDGGGVDQVIGPPNQSAVVGSF